MVIPWRKIEMLMGEGKINLEWATGAMRPFLPFSRRRLCTSYGNERLAISSIHQCFFLLLLKANCISTIKGLPFYQSINIFLLQANSLSLRRATTAVKTVPKEILYYGASNIWPPCCSIMELVLRTVWKAAEALVPIEQSRLGDPLSLRLIVVSRNAEGVLLKQNYQCSSDIWWSPWF